VKYEALADIGNTRIKWCLRGRTGPRVLEYWTHDPESWIWPPDWSASTHPSPVVWLAGVHPETRTALAQWCTIQGALVHVIRSFQQIPIPIHPSLPHPDSIGHDRLLGAYAAWRETSSGTGVMSADLGTATTINWVDPDGEFRGGWILPGLSLMGDSLTQRAAQLPPIRWSPPAEKPEGASLQFPGRTTTEAMMEGILAATRGALEIAYHEITQKQGHSPAWFLTGGAAQALRLRWPECSAQIRPDLVLQGLDAVAESLG